MFYTYREGRETTASGNARNKIILLAASTPFTVNEKIQEIYEKRISQRKRFEPILNLPSEKDLRDDEIVAVSVCGHFKSQAKMRLR